MHPEGFTFALPCTLGPKQYTIRAEEAYFIEFVAPVRVFVPLSSVALLVYVALATRVAPPPLYRQRSMKRCKQFSSSMP